MKSSSDAELQSPFFDFALAASRLHLLNTFETQPDRTFSTALYASSSISYPYWHEACRSRCGSHCACEAEDDCQLQHVHVHQHPLNIGHVNKSSLLDKAPPSTRVGRVQGTWSSLARARCLLLKVIIALEKASSLYSYGQAIIVSPTRKAVATLGKALSTSPLE